MLPKAKKEARMPEMQQYSDNMVDKTVSDTQKSAGNKGLGMSTAVQTVWLAVGLITVLLMLRFVLRLVGASPDNGFINLIYTISYPLVVPFMGIFKYNANFTNYHLELGTLFAMLVYMGIGWVTAMIISLKRR